ncbi:solute carrier family 24 (sodium/potassium/calcium exchanger), member 6 [Mytilus galloprovincialis]|uniref:Solute carrier family 24 (Sodium/potassium/calcium exchanger), member 6 n=1 Tax=Mytilus galloprovincialis TaxID=29158 RepID=A0A8B6DLV3_MYTGA|nr:solute carrier family 24 (sodium/potassium/calcium exchanger), member 6 [Mytilus galloprovincialis]
MITFGNGAPDIFSAIAAVGNAKNGDAGLAFGALLGAGVFVTTVVAGTIAIICPFDAMQRPFLRDVIFYLLATFLTFTVLWQKEIGKIEAIGYILLYVLYVLIVVIGRYFYQKTKKTTVLAEITVSPEDADNYNESYPNSVETSREDYAFDLDIAQTSQHILDILCVGEGEVHLLPQFLQLSMYSMQYDMKHQIKKDTAIL